jgi:hypothetical protein
MSKKFSICLILLTFLIGSPYALAAATNVALNANVQLDGSPFFTGGWTPPDEGYAVSETTVVDGIFLPRSNWWNRGPVWWDPRLGDGTYQNIQIQLDAVYEVESLIIQADNNDTYEIYYWNLDTWDWDLAWTIEQLLGGNWGMQTRPDPTDDTVRHPVTPFLTNAFRIGGVDPTDNYFAVSEFQAFGYPLNVYDCYGFEPPMDKGPVRVRGNRALPLKAHVFDGDGFEITGADVIAPPVMQIWHEYGTPEADLVDDADALPAGQGDEGNKFVYTGERWQFNLKTGDYAEGTYTVFMTSGDPTEYTISDPTCEAQFVVQ